MTEITFIEHDGTKTTVSAGSNDSVMQAAVANGIEGILAECGGAMMCATCHGYVDESFIDKTGRASGDEKEMLGFAYSEVKDNSRLCCQIKVTEDLDGLVVHLPEEQI